MEDCRDVLCIKERTSKYINVIFKPSKYSSINIITAIDKKDCGDIVGNDDIIGLGCLYRNIDEILETFELKFPFIYDLGKDIKDFILTIINGQTRRMRGRLSNCSNRGVQDIKNSIGVTVDFRITDEMVEVIYNYNDHIKRYDLKLSDRYSFIEINGEKFDVYRDKDECGKDFCTLSKTIYRTLPKLPLYSELMDTSEVDKLFKSLGNGSGK